MITQLFKYERNTKDVPKKYNAYIMSIIGRPFTYVMLFSHMVMITQLYKYERYTKEIQIIWLPGSCPLGAPQ